MKNLKEITDTLFDKYSHQDYNGVNVITETQYDYLVEELIVKLNLPEVSSTFTGKEIAFSLNATTLIDGNGVEYILDGKELYKKELVEKYTLVTNNQP